MLEIHIEDFLSIHAADDGGKKHYIHKNHIVLKYSDESNSVRSNVH